MDTSLHGTHSAKVIQVIQTTSSVGVGTEKNPNRIVIEFWSLGGELLAVNEPHISPTAERGA